VGRLLATSGRRLNFAEASLMTHVFNPESGAFFDLSSRLKLRFSGSDVFRFLNGQISNDLRKATATSAIQASVLNAKGKLNGNVFVSADAGSFVIDADPEVRADLPPRMERYIIADDVQIEDLTDEFGLFHITGNDPPKISRASRILRADRFGCQGWDIWAKREEIEQLRQQLSTVFSFCDDEYAESFRIEQGIPRWGRELTDQIIPTEANLEASSIDYGKGCYIGQEVISRIKMSGQTNKRLAGFVSVNGAPLSPGMRLNSLEGERKEAGWITSATRGPRLGKEIALGYIKRGFEALGSRFQAHSAEGVVETDVLVEHVALPFV